VVLPSLTNKVGVIELPVKIWAGIGSTVIEGSEIALIGVAETAALAAP
jgi:hypothetical protein